MSLASTPLPEEQASKKKKPCEAGFSLLEVIVALAIMALGFFTVMQLFSGSIRTVGLSEQYLKAVILAHSKMGELELASYRIDDSAARAEWGWSPSFDVVATTADMLEHLTTE